MLYESFYCMIFTHHSAGKIWSSICMQDIVKPGLHCKINLIRLMYHIIINLYQICLTNICLMKIIIYMFRTQRRIKNPTKHLIWSFLRMQLCLTGFWICLLLKNTLYTVVQEKVNIYEKVKSKYCKKGMVSCKSMRKLI